MNWFQRLWLNVKEGFWKLPFVWRLKYKYYHEQFIPAQKEGGSDIKWQLATVPYTEPPVDDYRFRCPHCGQAHIMLIDQDESVCLKQDQLIEKVWMEKARHGCNDNDVPGGPMWNYYMREFKVDTTKAIQCVRCTMTTPRWMWHHAFHEPSSYFDMEQLCHCGGEMYMQRIPGSDRFALVCERCNWVKPGVKISGAEGDLTK